MSDEHKKVFVYTEWIPIKVAHTSKIDKIWVVYCSQIWIGSIWL